MDNEINSKNNINNEYGRFEIILWLLCIISYTYLLIVFLNTKVTFLTSDMPEYFNQLIIFLACFVCYSFSKKKTKDYLTLILGIYTIIPALICGVLLLCINILLVLGNGMDYAFYGFNMFPFAIASVLVGLTCIKKFKKINY